MAGGWPFSHGRTVTVIGYELDPRTQDRVPDPAKSALVDGCAFDPGTSSADVAVGIAALSRPRLFGPIDLDVTPHTTTVTVPGHGDYEVDGEPLRWHNDLTGRDACSEVPLRREKGRR